MIASASLNSSEFLTLAQAARCFPKIEGRHPSLQTVKRRIIEGAFGVKLRAIKSGRRWLTTETWIREFEQNVTAKALPSHEQSTSSRASDLHAAEVRLLKEHGIDVARTETKEKGANQSEKVSDGRLRAKASSSRALSGLLDGVSSSHRGGRTNGGRGGRSRPDSGKAKKASSQLQVHAVS